ncbi:MAG: lytic transglycosylase domain-containing protein [SAR324 cluster bacterium]|nr:lytic transglycosylase domain-containing protein [SAR324 cluster bacterium]
MMRNSSTLRQALIRSAVLLAALALASCASSRRFANAPSPGRYASGYVKDNKPAIWISDHPRVERFRANYSRTTTVEKALRRGRRYLPTILREFRARRLPLELAYLPMLESMFENRANSGHARGLWQFTRGTAEHMGLNVGAFADERMNWHKATKAAADYLDELGRRFNYNWALALAAYNGGPGYVEQAMRSQHKWEFFQLRLRQETYEYVPRFIAMVQVAKEKYPHLLLAGR